MGWQKFISFFPVTVVKSANLEATTMFNTYFTKSEVTMRDSDSESVKMVSFHPLAAVRRLCRSANWYLVQQYLYTRCIIEIGNKKQMVFTRILVNEMKFANSLLHFIT